MKILYKILLFLVMMQLVSILFASLGVFPSGSIPASDTSGYKDKQGVYTIDSIMSSMIGEIKIDLGKLPIIGVILKGVSLTFNWATILGFFTFTLIVVAYVFKSTQAVVIGVMGILTLNMLRTSQKWVQSVTGDYGPTIAFLVTIIFVGVMFLWVISLIETHVQGDVSDR